MNNFVSPIESTYRLKLTLTALGLIAVILAACGAANECPGDDSFTPITGSDLEKIDKSLVTEEPCSPPCWHEIIPGVTSLTDAETILKSKEFIDASSIRYQQTAIGTQTLLWNSSVSDYRNWIGAIEGDADNQVDSITIQQIEYDIRIKDLIHTYGEPVGIFASLMPADAPPCYTVILVWPSYGLTAVLPTIHAAELKVNHHPYNGDTLVEGVVYNEAVNTIDEYIEKYRSGIAAGFMKWEGADSITLP